MRKPTQICLAVLLTFVMATVGCTDQWIKIAIADLPVLTQMALNIATIVGVLGNGQTPAPAEITAINGISAEAQRDLATLQTLYDQYASNPSTGTQAKIEDTIALLNQNLPAMLTAAHIKDPVLSARVNAAVALILNTVATFSALIPHPLNPAVVSMKAGAGKNTIPSPATLKAAWNRDVYPQFK